MDAPASRPYPVTLDIEYPDRELDRLTSFFRLIVVLPVAIILGLISQAGVGTDTSGGSGTGTNIGVGLWLATTLMILVRQKYPRWWFDWQLALARFGTRVEAYALLMRDEYPAVEEEQAVRVDIVYPDACSDLNRWLPLVKWLLVLPHYLVLIVITLVGILCAIGAWFAILFTGRYPRGLFDFNVGVLRYWLRVWAYAFLLTTDRYPPFSLRP